jgi:coenzyme F420-0:L-glutamate ligase / coenzyme F420-1:gamma-L-glutamate ligase
VTGAGPHGTVTIQAVHGIPEVVAADDLADLIASRIERSIGPLADGDIVVVSSKIVSKAEGRLVTGAGGVGDAARTEAVRAETVRVVAARGQTQIVQTRHGFVMAAAGVDASNVPAGSILLLPEDPDESARGLRTALSERCGVLLGVIVSDTFGRPWRLGQTDLAIGAAGVRVLDDHRGRTDAHGNELAVTALAHADELAAAAELVKGKVAQVPVAIVRGLGSLVTAEDGPGVRALVRPADDDLFRLGSREAAREALGQSGRPGLVDVPPDPEAVLRALAAVRGAADDSCGVAEIEDPAVRKSVLDALGLPSSAHAVVAYLRPPADAAGRTEALLDLGGLRDRLGLACRVERLTSHWSTADDVATSGVRSALRALLPCADAEPAGLLAIGTAVRDDEELPST